jgi:hypothetical protein
LYSSNAESVNPLELVRRHFHCGVVELWHFDIVRMIAQRYDPTLHEMVPITAQDHGIVRFSAITKETVNCPNMREHPSFSEEIDGKVDGPALVLAMDIGRRDTWVVALRGHAKPFNTADESQLNAILPFIVKSIAGFATNEEQSSFNTQLSELLDISTFLTSSLSPAVVYTIIRDQIQKLLQSEKALLYTVDLHQDVFLAHDQISIETPQYPISNGITGIAVASRAIVNVAEPVAHEKYDSEIDSVPAYIPKSLLGAPIFGRTRAVTAAIVLLTRLTGQRFDENDEKILTAVNVFARIALENAKKYQQSVKFTKKLNYFVDLTERTNDEAQVRPVLVGLLETEMKIMKLARLTIWIVDDQPPFPDQ